MTVEILERDGVALVFGLEWFPLLGSHPEVQARSVARARRASHRVVCAGGAAAVGLLQTGRMSRKRGQRYCSAAAAFARLHAHETVAAVMTLPGGRRWMVAVHEGAVMTRCDHLHDASAPMDETLSLLREAHPGLTVLDDRGSPAGQLDALFEAAMEGCELVGSRRRMTGRIVLLSLLLTAGVTLAKGGGLWGAREADVIPVQDAGSAWQDAIAESARAHRVHGVTGLQAALTAIYDVPVMVAGWHLDQVECRPRPSTWQCRSRYRRGNTGDNERFIAAAKADWDLSFDPMQGAEAAWSVPLPSQPLAHVRLHGPRQNEARLISALQAMLDAFTELRLDPPQAIPVRAPLDAQQLPLPRPPGLAAYQRRVVRLQAPLRSLALLLPETAHMSWDRILVQVTAVDQPTLRSSGLRASLSGVLYEKDHEPVRSDRTS